MKSHWAFLIFVPGLDAGCLVSHGGSHESAVAANETVARKHEARPAKNPHEAKFRSFAKQLPKLNEEEREAFEKSLAPANRAAAIEALLAQTSVYGLSGDASTMVSHILNIWAGDDFNGAWAWCQQIENDLTRQFIASQLLSILVDKDPDRALALHLKMAAHYPNFKFINSIVPTVVIQKASSKNAAYFLDIEGKLPFGVASQGNGVSFAADFNFQQAADGVTALIQSHDGKEPRLFPSNFISSWAVRDADAAYAWFYKNKEIASNDFGRILEGIEKKEGHDASIAWAAVKLNESGARRQDVISSFDRSFAVIPSNVSAIARSMPDAASSDRFLGDVVALNYGDNPLSDLGYAINQMSTPTVRLDAMQRLATRRRLDTSRISDAQIKAWSLTREQMEQAARH